MNDTAFSVPASKLDRLASSYWTDFATGEFGVFDSVEDSRWALPPVFEGRRQLIVQHFMFDPSWDDGCPSCTYALDDLGHLHEKDTPFAVISRAPLTKIEAYKQRKGWTVPWYSSFGGDFN